MDYYKVIKEILKLPNDIQELNQYYHTNNAVDFIIKSYEMGNDMANFNDKERFIIILSSTFSFNEKLTIIVYVLKSVY